MQTHSRLFRLTATTAIVGLTLGTMLPQIAMAQTPPAQTPPLLAPGADGGPAPVSTADPPTRVGRLSSLTGAVSFHGIGADHWDVASLNFPVTSGDSFWTQPGASVDVGVTNDRMTMDQSTELDITGLDDQNVVATLPQGQVYLRLRGLAPGERYTIATPRGTVAITTPGRYEIAAGDTDNPTRITVVDGAADVSGSDMTGQGQVAANQTMLITGAGPFQTQIVAEQRDAFLTAQLARERPAVASAVAVPAVCGQMTGAEDLSQYGTWQSVPQYGTVWYPQVAAGWVPYRQGHWAYVQPWGWTWIDAAPWGFAPFHYGRWVQVGGRWGWAPGTEAVAYGDPGYVAPVYAPALVTFFGIGAAVGVGVAVGVGIAALGRNIGWAPLGWQEPYRPWYRTSPGYLRAVNVPSVRNVTNINTVNNVTINNFANRGAATMVPASAMVGSRPIGQIARPVPAADLAQARPVFGRQPVAPTAATAGVNARVAAGMHLPPAPAGVASANRPGPGPAIRATPSAAGEAARPSLQAAGRRPGEAAAPGPGARETGAGALPGAVHAPGPPIEPHGDRPTGAEPVLRPPAAGNPAGRQEAAPGATRENPALRAPGVNDTARPGAPPQARPTPEAARPEAARPEAARPEAARPATPRPEAARPEAARPEAARPEAARPQPQQQPPRPQVQQQPRPQVQQRPQEARPQERPQPAPRPQERPQPAPRPAPHPAPQQHRPEDHG